MPDYAFGASKFKTFCKPKHRYCIKLTFETRVMGRYLETLNTRSGYLGADPCQWYKVFGQRSTILTICPLGSQKGLRVRV